MRSNELAAIVEEIWTRAPTGERAEARAADRSALRILLTNDDGWDAPGITAVRDALVAAGHRVVICAPSTNQSGTSASVAFAAQLVVTKSAEDVYAIGGSPAEATEFGLSVVFADRPPDLVISGANAGQNVGAVVFHSGTIGAVVTAVVEGVPAIAVSAEVDLATGSAAYDATAALVVSLIDELQRRARGDRLLPAGVGLNVNYPMVADDEEPDVALTHTGTGFIDLTFTGAELPTEPGQAVTFDVDFGLSEVDQAPYADTTALTADKITISVIEPDFELDADDHA